MIALLEDRITHYTEEELASLNPCCLPRHVSIVMDGNRRWAKRINPLKINSGHWQGAEVVDVIVEAAMELGIKELTLFAFSTENWKRSPIEVKTLCKILETYLKKKSNKMLQNGVHFDVIGDLTPFPSSIKNEVEYVKKITKSNDTLFLTLALNYGGRDEIRRACEALVQKAIKGEVNEVSEELIENHLDTSKLSPLDLFIRTSGEMRVSNFLLWQLSYAEIYVTKTLWPDFSPQELLRAVLEYQKRERRAGK